jgi:hypothetical protein
LPKAGWFLTPEASTLLLKNHVGKAVGVQLGLKLFNDHLKVGYYMYGRSGPINGRTFATQLPEGITYKGQSQVNLRADHGSFGLLLVPSFRLPGSAIEVDIPLMIGMLGGGFYLAGADRHTPDGRRVSAWKTSYSRAKTPALPLPWRRACGPWCYQKSGHQVGVLGLHYITTQGWQTYYDPSGDFYNNKLGPASLCSLAAMPGK